MKKEENVVAQSMRAGFTLVELMVVVSIVAVLGTIAVQNVMGNLEKANQTAAEQGVASLKEACATYYMNHKKLPSSLDQLCEGDDPILESDKGLYDPWDNKYEMEKKGNNRVIIKSAGPDGQMGTDDDIRSDAKKKKNG